METRDDDVPVLFYLAARTRALRDLLIDKGVVSEREFDDLYQRNLQEMLALRREERDQSDTDELPRRRSWWRRGHAD